MSYNGVINDLQLAQAETNYAQRDAATVNFLKGVGIGLIGMGAASGVQALIDSVAAENGSMQLAILNQTAEAFNEGLASAQDLVSQAESTAAAIGTTNSIRSATKALQTVAAAATNALAAWASGEAPLNNEDGVQALMSLLPDQAAALPVILDGAAQGILLHAESSGSPYVSGSGRAFWMLAREIKRAKELAKATARRCRCQKQ